MLGEIESAQSLSRWLAASPVRSAVSPLRACSEYSYSPVLPRLLPATGAARQRRMPLVSGLVQYSLHPRDPRQDCHAGRKQVGPSPIARRA